MTDISWWLNWATVRIVSSLWSLNRYPHPHWDGKKKTTAYCHTSLHGLIAQHFWLFFIVFFWHVSTSTHWDAKTNTTTYCHVSLDGFNAQQVQMFLDRVVFTGICCHTVIDRPRHHHILTLVAWCSWCWTIRCVSSFNYFNTSQFTHTNTKRNGYLRNDSCCCREEYNLHLKINWQNKKKYIHAKGPDSCFRMCLSLFLKHHGKLHHLKLPITLGMVEQVWINVSQCIWCAYSLRLGDSIIECWRVLILF